MVSSIAILLCALIYCHVTSSAPTALTHHAKREVTCHNQSAIAYRCAGESDPIVYFLINCQFSEPQVYQMECGEGTYCQQINQYTISCPISKHPDDEEPVTKETLSPISTLPPPPPPAPVGIPGGLKLEQVPLFVYFSVDDAVTHDAYNFAVKLLKGRTNPNGCPISATFNIMETDTKFDLVKKMHNELGFEIASHSCSHRTPTSWWRSASKEDWRKEMAGLRNVTSEKTSIPKSEIVGARTPFLEMAGNRQFEMLTENGFIYDSTMVPGNDPIWPFKLGRAPTKSQCNHVSGCPTASFPKMWELPLNKLFGCTYPPGFQSFGMAMVDSCRPADKDGSFKYLYNNFNRHYNHPLKVPLGLNMHFSWFTGYTYNFEAMKIFLDEIQKLPDVWIVSAHQLVQWMENPTNQLDMKQGKFPPLNCSPTVITGA